MFRSVRNELLLGTLAAAVCAEIGAASAPDSGGHTSVSLGTMSQPVRITVLGDGAHLPILNSTSDQGGNPTPVIPQTAPHPIREGQLINIPPGSPLRSEVTIAAVAAKEIQHTLTFTGVVEADPSRSVQVLAPIAGRVVDVKIQLGDRVAPDQELAVVYAGVAQAYSGDRRVQSTPALPNKLTPSSGQTGLQSNLSDAASDCQHVEAERLRSTTRLCAPIMPAEGTGETRLLSLRAPLAGSVIDLGVRPGVTLDDPSSSIMTIADLDTIWVTTSVRKKDAALVAPARRVEIAFIAYPNEVLGGEARLIGDVRDPYASSFKVRIESPNPTRRLKPNMSALATLLGPKETVPIIPPTALINRNERDWVFVEVGQWTFEARRVKVGFPQEDQTVAVSGLNIGERIVVMGGALLQD
jgi:cobalt-zinc-cadmium efflux system membrane fusion protein